MASKYWSLKSEELIPEDFRKLLDRAEKIAVVFPGPMMAEGMRLHAEAVRIVRDIRAARLAFHDFKCV